MALQITPGDKGLGTQGTYCMTSQVAADPQLTFFFFNHLNTVDTFIQALLSRLKNIPQSMQQLASVLGLIH